MDKCLDVKLIAESLAQAILRDDDDQRIIFGEDGSVRLRIARIVPKTDPITTSSRRSLLRAHLSAMLARYGWKEIHPNIYRRVMPIGPKTTAMNEPISSGKAKAIIV